MAGRWRRGGTRGGKEAWEGVTCSLLVSENRQGILLPDNTDPWKKLPDSIPEKKAVCTYLEMRGDYKDDGITISDMGFRMYLGNDATTDFDIVRNTAYTVTVGIDDKATAELLSWKVVPGTVDDKRKLSWSPNPDTLKCERTLDVTPKLETSTNASTTLDFSFEGLDGLGVTYTRSGNSLHFSSSKQLSEVKKFYVTASTPDGRHSSKLTVVVQPRYPVKLVASCTEESRWMKITESVWKFDWYKINNVEETPSRTVSYTVRATYNDGYEANVTSGAVPSISTSASIDGGGIAIDTRGMIRGAGGHNGYGNGTLKFSYTEHGKTAKCSVEWWRIGVTQVKLPFNNIILGTEHQYVVSEAMQNVAAVVYNDGTSEMPANAKFYNEHSTMTSTRTDIVNIFHGSDFCYIQGVHTGKSNVSCAYSYRGTMFSCSLTVDPLYKIFGSDDIRYPPSGNYELQVTDGSGWVQSTDEISCGSVSGSGSISATDIWNAYHQKGQIVTATIYGGNASKTINIEGEP